MDDVRFAENLLQLLDRGRFTTTYKYAVLLGLMDLCLESVTKSFAAPDFVTTRQLSEKVASIYWSHTQAYDTRILKQNISGETGILKLISGLRGPEAISFFKAHANKPEEFKRTVLAIEDILIRMPLPKLQRFDGQVHEILYRIFWDDDIKSSIISEYQRSGLGFDNRINFVNGAAERLLRLNTLLRPLIYREWATKVADINDLEEARLETFLFGMERDVPAKLRAPLLDLHRGNCFYCARPINSDLQIDHFIPFARYPDNRIQNLLPAHANCNLAKKDFLAATVHIEHWVSYLQAHARDLVQIGNELEIDQHPTYSLAAARGLYKRLDESADLWQSGNTFEKAMPDKIKVLLSV